MNLAQMNGCNIGYAMAVLGYLPDLIDEGGCGKFSWPPPIKVFQAPRGCLVKNTDYLWVFDAKTKEHIACLYMPDDMPND